MRKNYVPCDINSTEFQFEFKQIEKTDKRLLNNFFKCAEWIEKNCRNLNGTFECKHNPYSWTKLVVENGKAYLEYGSHGYSFEYALSTTETATMTTGSCQSDPYAFENTFFFRNDALEEFLREWASIKNSIIIENEIQNKIYDENFVP